MQELWHSMLPVLAEKKQPEKQRKVEKTSIEVLLMQIKLCKMCISYFSHPIVSYTSLKLK